MQKIKNIICIHNILSNFHYGFILEQEMQHLEKCRVQFPLCECIQNIT